MEAIPKGLWWGGFLIDSSGHTDFSKDTAVISIGTEASLKINTVVALGH